jgi:hypothetical protein
MSNKKQTAVEWLEEELKHIIPITFLGKFNQAKEMEKQQIVEAFKSGDCNGTFETINAKQYYNETFKQL